MQIINFIIGLIAIGLIILRVYAIGRITIHIVDPTEKKPNIETTILAAALAIMGMIAIACIAGSIYLLGTVIIKYLH